jgi:hypothetical protein
MVPLLQQAGESGPIRQPKNAKKAKMDLERARPGLISWEPHLIIRDRTLQFPIDWLMG